MTTGIRIKLYRQAALHRVLEAELIAPELTRNHAMVREMVSAMLHRREGRSATPGLRELADRVGVLNWRPASSAVGVRRRRQLAEREASTEQHTPGSPARPPADV